MHRTARPLARNPTGENSTAVASAPHGIISPRPPPRIVAVGNKRVAVSDKFDFSHYDPVRSAGCFSGQPFGSNTPPTSTKTLTQYEHRQGFSEAQASLRGPAAAPRQAEAFTQTSYTQAPSKTAKCRPKTPRKPFWTQNTPSHLPNGVPLSLYNGDSSSVPDEQQHDFEPLKWIHSNGPGAAPLVPAMGTEQSTVSFSQHRRNVVRTTWNSTASSTASQTNFAAKPRHYPEEPDRLSSSCEESSRYPREIDSRIMNQMPSKMRRLQAERDEVADKLKEARAELERERQETSSCRTNMQDLKEKYDELNRQHDTLKLQHDNLKLQQWEIQEKLKKLERECTKTCKENGNLKMQNERLKKKSEGLKRDNDTAKKKNTILKMNYKTSVTEKEGLHKKIDELQRALEEKETQKQRLQEELAALTGMLGTAFRKACQFNSGRELQEDSELQTMTQSMAFIPTSDEPQNYATNNRLQRNQNEATNDAYSDSESTVAPSEATTASRECSDRAETSECTESGRRMLILKLTIGRDGLAKFQETN